MILKSRGPRFQSNRERSWWLLSIAVAAAACWAAAQALAWPVAIRALLAVIAAVVAVAVPELRALGARADRREQLLGRLEIFGVDGALPRLADVTPEQLGVHAAQAVVPYIERDLQHEVDERLVDRRPLLLIGHSMSGKTRLAVERLQELLPDARVLVPQSGASLREVVDAGLQLAAVVVWLDEIERFLRGDHALDSALLQRILKAGGVVVATMRLLEFENYRPTNDLSTPEWSLLSKFERLKLGRTNTAGELARVRAEVNDPAVLSGIEEYGLAEYLGAGPNAVETFDHGETTHPVGHALVRVAIDWRRAGLVRVVSIDELRSCLPAYLAERREVMLDDPAIEDGLIWARTRINETVALLREWRPDEQADQPAVPHYRVFDYLVDVVAAREDATIPVQLWIEVAKRAVDSEGRDVARAANRYFVGRSSVIAQVAQWLALPSTDAPSLMMLIGSPWSGKTALLTQLSLLTVPATREHASINSLQPRLNLPPIDVNMRGWQMTSSLLIAELCRATGSPVRAGSTVEEAFEILLVTLDRRTHPFVVVIDALDEARSLVEVVNVIARLAERSYQAPIRILVSSRRLPQLLGLQGAAIIDLDDPGHSDPEDIRALVQQRLLAPGSVYVDRPHDVDQIASSVALRLENSYATAYYFANELATGRTLLDDLWMPSSVSDAITAQLRGLGSDEPEVRTLLTTLALGPTPGYSLDEWASAHSRRTGVTYGRHDLEGWLPVFEQFLTNEPVPTGTRYRFCHAALHDYFAHQV